MYELTADSSSYLPGFYSHNACIKDRLHGVKLLEISDSWI